MPIARARVARITDATPRSAFAVFHDIALSMALSHDEILTNVFLRLQGYEPRRIFLPPFSIADFPNMAISEGIPYDGGLRRRPGSHAHGGTGLAPRHHVWCP